MTRLAEIQGHIASMDELLDIVGAMRSLAGMRVQEAQHALPGVRRYSESMEAAISAALLLMSDAAPEPPEDHRRRALILYAAEHGFVGGFNERLIEAAEAFLKPADSLFVLGGRGAALAIERGLPVVWSQPMSTRLAGAPDAADRLASELYRRIVRGEILQVDVMFCRYRQGEASSVERRRLLPIDPALLAKGGARQPPLHNLEPRALLESLMAEYVFARFTEAAVESIASENAARFSAMESAHDNVSKKLEQLRQSARQARQTEITAELLDLITGVETLAGERPRAR